MKKNYIVYVGNYGSGKTELSLNTALCMAGRGKAALVDMDIVNPYFRSSEHNELLDSHGVRLIKPPFANTTVDVPALSAEVQAAFHYEYAVFDVGGDPVGAKALGGLKPYFDGVRNDTACYYVINARRPFQENVDDVLEMLGQIQANARLRVDGLVNNTNIAGETTLDDVVFGARLCDAIGKKTGIPVEFTAGLPEIMDAYQKTGYKGEVVKLRIFTRPEWMEK